MLFASRFQLQSKCHTEQYSLGVGEHQSQPLSYPCGHPPCRVILLEPQDDSAASLTLKRWNLSNCLFD